MMAVYLAVCLLGTLRMFGVTHIAFQAVAHLFMGGLAVAWWKNRSHWQLLVLFITLTILETVCAFMLHHS
jgi:uncharacterized membrane protein YcaP (DUF421 family)